MTLLTQVTLVTMRPRGWRRVRGGMAKLRMLRLLALSALCGWAWSAAKAGENETMGQSDHQMGRPWDGDVWMLLVSLSGCLIVWLVVASVRRQRAEDGEAEIDPYAGHWPSGDGQSDKETLRQGDRETELRRFLAGRGVRVVTTFDLETLRDLACSEQSLLAVDRFMRWRFKKVLFMTSLMEIVALAGRLRSDCIDRSDEARSTLKREQLATEEVAV